MKGVHLIAQLMSMANVDIQHDPMGSNIFWYIFQVVIGPHKYISLNSWNTGLACKAKSRQRALLIFDVVQCLEATNIELSNLRFLSFCPM